jgi:hypothetical protein
MNLNDLLKRDGLDPERVLVLRHRPQEPGLNKILPWLAAEQPDVFNAYQQTQNGPLEKAMAALVGRGHVASFIGREPGSALFVGLYAIAGAKPLTGRECLKVPAYAEMNRLRMHKWTEEEKNEKVLWFDLKLTKLRAQWKGRLVVGWPPPERSWWRRAHRNEFPVLAIHEDSALDSRMPAWNEIDFTWEDLRALPKRLKAVLAEWRAIYYIFDTSDRKGYVGSAYGEANLLGRWLNYAADGHGGNRLLRGRDPRNFRFTVLQRVSPDMDAAEVIRLEATWKERLHTREPVGLNEN